MPVLGGLALFAGALSLKGDPQAGGKLVLVMILGFPVILLLTLAAQLMHRALRSPRRLTLSEQGLYYEGPFFALRCNWQNVRGLGPVSYGRLQVQGLQLNAPAESQSFFWFMGATPVERQGIPLAPFADPEENAELKAWLQKKLPSM